MIYNELKIEELRDQVTDLRRENEELRNRLDGCGTTHFGAACAYSDSLVVEGKCRFGGELTRLEWMLRNVVGHSRRQQKIIDRLRSDATGPRGDTTGLWGDTTGLTGDATGLWGNATGLTGDCVDLWQPDTGYRPNGPPLLRVDGQVFEIGDGRLEGNSNPIPGLQLGPWPDFWSQKAKEAQYLKIDGLIWEVGNGKLWRLSENA